MLAPLDGEQTVYFVSGGCNCFLRTPPTYTATNAGAPVPLVVYCHGNGGYIKCTDDGYGETDWIKLPAGEANKRLFVDSLVGAGFAVAASDAHGMHAWGNPQSVAATAALLSSVLSGSNVDAKRVGMWGGGAGGAVAWSAALGPLMGKVRAVAMQQSCLSYESVIRDGKFKDVLLEGGYGMPPDTPDDDAVLSLKHNDPLYRTSLLIAELGDATAAAVLPEAFFLHGDADENILYEENPVALGKLLEGCGAAHTFHTPAGVGHNVFGAGVAVAKPFLEFFAKALATTDAKL